MNGDTQIAFELGLGERTMTMRRAAVLAPLHTPADLIRLAIEAGF